MVERKRSSKERAEEGGNYFAKQQEGVEFFSSGCKTLDLILGGGWAEERTQNIIGDSSTGKTLLAIEAATNFLKKHDGKTKYEHIDLDTGKKSTRTRRKGKVRYRESEHAFDDSYAEAIGMPVDRVDFGEADTPFETIEDLYEEIDYRCKEAKKKIAKEEEPDPQLVIVDSLDSLTSRAEQGRKIDEDSYGGEKAKKLGELFRRQIGPMKQAHITLMIISQTRDKIGVTFGKKWTRAGGRALQFYCSQIIYLAHKQHVYRTKKFKGKDIKRAVGDTVIAKTDKMKVGLPFRQTEFDILFGFGVDDLNACLDYAKENACDEDIFDHFKIDEKVKNPKLKLMNILDAQPDQEFRESLQDIHKIIDTNWWEIEKSFLPERRKY